jgi:methionine aminopeptidase
MTVLKTRGEIDLMDQANRIVHQVLDAMDEMIAPGVTPRQLNRHAEQVIRHPVPSDKVFTARTVVPKICQR